ncbi:MAG: hypothetical protein F6K48_12940 [Okeania sp. SIO3H1]|uniref:hypothetical protein n=1 Tax=Okeania sp. SIO1I7 TaxID=2607772 RepID=UPI0013CC18D7|nr:hypothetical protein [Okeania sp. SIO1I7]NEN89761.1 hypothetical protein [Okeania sp. SIO3H1]NET27387.1 hypothetical protein [Okeania sp. SIO1I7]
MDLRPGAIATAALKNGDRFSIESPIVSLQGVCTFGGSPQSSQVVEIQEREYGKKGRC